MAPPVQAVDTQEIVARHERAALKGIGIFRRAERTNARTRAQAIAHEEIQAAQARRARHHERLQAELDLQWDLLLKNDPEVLVEVLEEAFEDNQAPAAAIGADGSEVSVVVLAPEPEFVPDRMPTLTAAGNLSLKKMTKSLRSAFYAQVVAGTVIATVRETFAVAPSVENVRIVAIRSTGPDSYGKPRAECLLAAVIPRVALAGIQWERAEANEVINDTASELLVNQRGQTKELSALDLSSEPELRTLLSQIDLEELTAPSEPVERGWPPPPG